MKPYAASLAAAIGLIAAPSLLGQSLKPADAVYYHGRILTGEGLDRGALRFVSALAIRGGVVAAAGSDERILKLAGPQTRKFDLNGAFVVPGFNDAHVHLGGAGRTRLSIDLTTTRSLAEMLRRIELNSASTPAGQWLQGSGWDHTLWPRQTLPTRADLDAVTDRHPAIFERIDGHIAVANSAALAAAGITRNTPDPPGGKIDRDVHGEPTGILRETAMGLVTAKIPPPTAAFRRRGLELAMADAVTWGVTSAQDNSDWEDFLALEQIRKEDKLPLRVTEWLSFDAPLDALKTHSAAHDPNDRMLHTGMLKGFLDGSLGSHTAAMKAPYADEPGNSGIPRYDQATLNRMTVERAQAGFQIGFHAIGDRAVAMALDAFEAAEDRPGPYYRPRRAKFRPMDELMHYAPRFRIEHAQAVDPADIPRFKELGVVASMQPSHLLTDMNWALDRLGPGRARYSYSWKQFLEAGVAVAFGTDDPVEPVTPFRGLYAAVTRRNEAGSRDYFPEDKLTIAQALYAYTQGSAFAEFAETWKGKLLPGYVADFAVLDRDLTRIPADQILKTRVLRTIVNGREVYIAGMRAMDSPRR